MYIPGLVSISFRKLSVSEILKLCVENGLQAVEWGGDIHVPHGDLKKARETAKMSADAGIEIVSYGSYYRVGEPMEDFERCLDTACELGSPAIRIWAGTKWSCDVTPDERKVMVEQMNRIVEKTDARGLAVAPEFHIITLMDSLDSVRQLKDEVPGMKLYWQPRWDWTEEDRLEALEIIGDRLMHMHVFTWRIEGRKEIKLPLAVGESMWKKVFAQPRDRCYALMEFVENDDPANLVRDAKVLHGWI